MSETILYTTLAVEKYTNNTQQEIFLESETERYLNDDDLFIYPLYITS